MDQLLEALAADTAAVPPLGWPVHSAPVPGEPGGRGEGLGALWAGQLGGRRRWQGGRRGLGGCGGGCCCGCRCCCGWGRPALACMRAPMVEELGHVAERLATAAAMQGVGGVGPPVCHQRELCAKAAAAVHAEVACFTAVQSQVLLQGGSFLKDLGAGGTLVRAPDVGPPMSQQPVGRAEAALALAAVEGLSPRSRASGGPPMSPAHLSGGPALGTIPTALGLAPG